MPAMSWEPRGLPARLQNIWLILSSRLDVLTRQLMDLFISLTQQNMTCHYFEFFSSHNISFTSSQISFLRWLHGETSILNRETVRAENRKTGQRYHTTVDWICSRGVIRPQWSWCEGPALSSPQTFRSTPGPTERKIIYFLQSGTTCHSLSHIFGTHQHVRTLDKNHHEQPWSLEQLGKHFRTWQASFCSKNF